MADAFDPVWPCAEEGLVVGGVAATPEIDTPEVAIVGVNRIAVRPARRNNRFAPGETINLSSSFDHRVADGQEAAPFVRRINDLLEGVRAEFFLDAAMSFFAGPNARQGSPRHSGYNNAAARRPWAAPALAVRPRGRSWP